MRVRLGNSAPIRLSAYQTRQVESWGKNGVRLGPDSGQTRLGLGPSKKSPIQVGKSRAQGLCNLILIAAAYIKPHILYVHTNFIISASIMLTESN